MMTEEAREAQRAYKREWIKKNPEKKKAQNERYWARKAEKLKAEKLAAVEAAAE